jgi:hypothetical protein
MSTYDLDACLLTLITLTFCVPIHAPQVLDDAPCKKSQIITIGMLETFIVYCMSIVSKFPIVAMLSLDVPQAPYVPNPQPLKMNGNLSIVFLKLQMSSPCFFTRCLE